MKKTMKKITAVLLAAALTVGFSLTAFAADDGTMTSEAGSFNFTKAYDSTDGETFPSETLEFTVTADENNPDDKAITVGTDNTFAVNGVTNDVPVYYPAFSKVGVYRYTIKEKAGSSQGVTYDTTTEIKVAIMVAYNEAHTALEVTAGVEKTDPDAEKVDTITNKYELGGDDEDEEDKTKGVTVKKTVEGNLGDQSKLFTIKVTLTAEEGKTVNSDITIYGGSDDGNSQTIGKGWTGSQEVTIKLKHDETVSFSKIPVGVTYVVEEDASHIAAGEAPTAAELNDEEGYLATYTNKTGTITLGETKEAGVTNKKETTINTGISLDSIPYVMMMMAAVALSAYVIFSRRRVED
jgi:pilin isopeptide linkage protein